MVDDILKAKLCRGALSSTPEIDEDVKKIVKVVAPFLRTLKKRKRMKTDVVAEEYKELYLKSSPNELLQKLQTSYSDPLRVTTLLNETGELLKAVTKSKCFNLYTTDYDRGEIVLISPYVSKDERFEQRYPIETGTYLACHVAYTKEYVISADIIGDPRFPDGIPNAGRTVKAAICVPIITNTEDNCIGVIELYKDCNSPSYDLINLQICSALTAWLGIAVEQNVAKLNFAKEADIHKQIAKLSDLYFSRTLSFGKVLSDILKILKAAVGAERGAFYVFNETIPLGSNETIFAEAFEEGFSDNDSTILFKKRTQIKYVKNEPGIPGYVARSGEILIIRDAYKDNRFDRSHDSPFFRTRSLLCFPIQSCNGVIAVLKLINSTNYSHFRKEDIDLMLPHLNELGLICQHYELDNSFTKLQLKLVVGSRLLESETKPPPEEISFIKSFITGDPLYPLLFFKFDWELSGYEDESIRIISMAMMNSEIFENCFEAQNLIDFLLRVKKAHRPLAYHNFEHAFSVFHCFFLIVTKNKNYFNFIEAVCLSIAALCHDIDHSGLTNNFIRLKNDSLAQLYEDFCGEIHRHEVTMFLIQASNVLSKFSSQDFQLISKQLRRLMVAFDLGVHFSNRKEITEILNSNQFNWEYPEHRFLAQNMILICADNCAAFKNVETAKKLAFNFHKELYNQGDLERSMEFEPLPMMDRSRIDIVPECQITYMTVVVLPVVQIIITLFPNMAILMDLATLLLEKWKEILGLRGQEMWKVNMALLKDKKDKKIHRVSVSRSSSIRTFTSEK